MTTIISRAPSPFGDLLALRQAMDRLFEQSSVRPGTAWGEGSLMPMDVYSADDGFVLEAHLPGVKPEEVDITVENDTLTISGETRSSRREGQGATILQEIRRGHFARTLTLPVGLEPDNARATFEDGVLTLRIPRAERGEPRQIETGGKGRSRPATIESK